MFEDILGSNPWLSIPFTDNIFLAYSEDQSLNEAVHFQTNTFISTNSAEHFENLLEPEYSFDFEIKD